MLKEILWENQVEMLRETGMEHVRSSLAGRDLPFMHDLCFPGNRALPGLVRTQVAIENFASTLSVHSSFFSRFFFLFLRGNLREDASDYYSVVLFASFSANHLHLSSCSKLRRPKSQKRPRMLKQKPWHRKYLGKEWRNDIMLMVQYRIHSVSATYSHVLCVCVL
jgi:hypothetical protein